MSLAPEPVLMEETPAGAAFITINRPDRRNAFDEITIDALRDRFETLKGADQVHVVFLRGAAGDFSAGADLDMMRRQGERSRHDNERDALSLARMLRALHDLPQLTVALVEGAAMGGGAGLVAAVDYAVAVEGAQFRFSETRLGLTPATISPYVIEAIGARRARGLFATAMAFDAQRALQIGLVDEIVADQEGLRDAIERISDLAFATAPGAVAAAKRLVRDVAGRPIDDALAHETARRIADRRASEEGREGVAAFLERREPSWRR